MSRDFFIGRQPILDLAGNIYAYELLFRHPGEVVATVLDNSAATARVLINAIQNIGLESLLGGRTGFINIEENIIMEGMIELLPRKQFVMEILETTKVTEEVVSKVIEYKEMGYSFALDDMVLSREYYDNFKPLFRVVDFIKIDYVACDKSKIKSSMETLKKLNVKMLAEKVETQEDFDHAKEMGFDLFQGYYFAKPVIISSKSFDPSKAATVELINMLRSDAESYQLENVIKSYPDLYINLLRFMNSAAFYTKGNVTSIKHAMALLGRNNLTKWLYLILYAGPNNDSFDNPLLQTAQIRASTMESLCRNANISKDKADSAYLVGLISLMDAVFNRNIDDVINEFNLDAEIKSAVTEKAGELGMLLKTMLDYETDDMLSLKNDFEAMGINFEKFNEIMLQSFEEAERFKKDE